MSGVATAVVGAAVIGAVVADQSSKRAESSQRQGAQTAAQAQQDQYYQTRADQQPWLQAGTGALSQLSHSLGVGGAPQNGGYNGGVFAGSNQKNGGIVQEKLTPGQSPPDYSQRPTGEYGSLTKAFDPSTVASTPGYQFRMNEGIKALDASASASGRLNSGRTMKELTRFGQDYASSEFNNAYNRYSKDQTDRFNRLSALAGVGQTANTQVGQAGQYYANNISNTAIGMGNAQAARAIQQGNNISNVANSAAQAYGYSQGAGK